MVRRRTLLTAAGTVLTASIAGCTDVLAGTDGDDEPDPTDTPAGTRTPTSTPEPRVELVGAELVRRDAGSDDELVAVSGTVESVAETTLAEVVVTATFRDGSGSPVDTATADLTEVSPGKRWEFRIYFPGSGERAAVVEDYDLDLSVAE